MKILLIDIIYEENSIFKNEFVKPIEKILKNENFFNYEIISIWKLTEKKIKDFDKIIICGTAMKDFIYLKNIQKFSWIKKTTKSILGICGGYQIIGLIFGGKLINNKKIGIFEIETFNKVKTKIFNQNKLKVYSLHNKSLINIEKEFIILGKSKNTIQIIKHKSKEIYGTLFHPEIKNKEIIINFIKN